MQNCVLTPAVNNLYEDADGALAIIGGAADYSEYEVAISSKSRRCCGGEMCAKRRQSRSDCLTCSHNNNNDSDATEQNTLLPLNGSPHALDAVCHTPAFVASPVTSDSARPHSCDFYNRELISNSGAPANHCCRYGNGNTDNGNSIDRCNNIDKNKDALNFARLCQNCCSAVPGSGIRLSGAPMRPKAPPPAYYYDTSPDATTTAAGSGNNDALTVSSTANTVGADSDASPPPLNESAYASGDAYSARLPRPQQLQSQRLIFPPPPPAPPPIFPPALSASAASRLFLHSNNNINCTNNNNNSNNNSIFGNNNGYACDEALYQCTDALTYSHQHHYRHAHNSLPHGGAHHYAPAPDSGALMSPLCHKSAGGDALLGGVKCSPSTSATNSSDVPRGKQRGCRASSRSNGGLSAIFRVVPKTAFFAAISFLFLLVALAVLLLQRHKGIADYGGPYLYENEQSGLLYGSCIVDSSNNEDRRNKVPIPRNVRVGESVYADLPPRRIVYTELSLTQSAHVVLNISVLPHARLVVYGRQTLAPTPAQHAFQQIVSADRLHVGVNIAGNANRQIASASALPLSSQPQKVLKYALVAQFLSAGRWFFGFLNDHQKSMPVSIAVSITPAALSDAKIRLDYDGASESTAVGDASADAGSAAPSYNDDEADGDGANPTATCRFDCFGKGVCVRGKCRCHPGYSGKYCEQTACPVLCSGNGVFANGACVCHEGFKGAECDTVANWCAVPDCNGHGVCSANGRCECDAAWEGEFCERRACQPDPDCSGHGVCQSGRCYCAGGRWGDACERVVGDACVGSAALFGAPPTKFPHGSGCDASTCVHGTCRDGSCVCATGWTGAVCNVRQTGDSAQQTPPRCLPGCEEHGVCHRRRTHYHKRSFTVLTTTSQTPLRSITDTEFLAAADNTDAGTYQLALSVCECFAGWTGANCQVSECGRHNCSGAGECRRTADGINWRCTCDAQHFGDHCQFRRELFCDDGIDNDGDGLTDCEDSWECCGHAACAQSTLCLSSLVPRNFSPPETGSFLDRYRFLFEKTDGTETTQRYTDVKNFDPQRIAVLRGRVLSTLGGPLTGVRVSDARNAHYGFTITRGGAADSDENGAFDLAVNGGETIELLFLRKPYLGVKRSFVVRANEVLNVGDVFLDAETRPRDDASGSGEATRTCHQRLNKIQQRLERDHVPAVSIASQGQSSVANITLLSADVPSALRVVHVEMRIAGNAKSASLAARSRLRHTFVWDRRDVYGNMERDRTIAKVRIGYEYNGEELCGRVEPEVAWQELSATFESLSP